jgi:hypothetical protein
MEYIYDVFISYNWNSKSQVEILEKNLQKNGLIVWRDVNELTAKLLAGQIANAIDNSKSFICCITKKYCESYYCNLEFEYAIKAQKKMIILMIEDINPVRMTRINVKNRSDVICGIGFHIK